MMTNQSLQEQIHGLMDDYAKRPSNANKQYHAMLALFQSTIQSVVPERKGELSKEILSRYNADGIISSEAERRGYNDCIEEIESNIKELK